MIKELWYLPRPRKVNKYPGGFPLHFEKRLFQTYKPRLILQPFGGKAEYGIRCDITADLGYGANGESWQKGNDHPDVIADAHSLPFKDNSFDFVLCDPPYSTDLSGKLYATGKIKQRTFTQEAVRVCKVGGHVGLYLWVMSARPKGTRYDRIIIIIGRVGHHARFCCIFQKVKDLFAWGNSVESEL